MAKKYIGRTDSAANADLDATFTVARGGTGKVAFTLGAMLLGNGVGAVSELAPGAAGGYPRSDGATWARSTGVPAADVQAGTFGGAFTFSGAISFGAGLTVSSGTTAVQALTATTGTFSSTVGMGALTATTGSFSGAVTFTAAASKVVPGATSWAVRNNADNANNLLISDAGVATHRSDIIIPSTARFYPDGGGNTYITESAADFLQFVVNGSDLFSLQISGAALVARYFGMSTNGNERNFNIMVANGTAPAGNPTGGYLLWAEAGAFKGRGTSGTVTTIGLADPHCPSCGRDFMLEWENEEYGKLQICMWCVSEKLGKEHEGHVVKKLYGTHASREKHLKPQRERAQKALAA